MYNILPLDEWQPPVQKPLLIAGPCSAETEEQVIQVAKELQGKIQLFRAGIWKPRTRPGMFEGVGIKGLPWLQRVKKEFGIPVTIEVASPEHVEAALKHNIDVLWVGARTTVNPFQVQQIADALQGVDIPIMVKNPVNPDIDLWIGAIERFIKSGKNKIIAVHRGFSYFGQSKYRNKPTWEIPIELRRRVPELPLICDPSHISGKRELIPAVAQKALDLGFDGLMVETHCNPDAALSDKEQQLTPTAFKELLEQLIFRGNVASDPLAKNSLQQLRSMIDKVDEQLIELLAERMGLSEKIGDVKKEAGIAIYQPERWNEIVNHVIEWSQEKNISPELAVKLYEFIHKESIKVQSAVMNKKRMES